MEFIEHLKKYLSAENIKDLIDSLEEEEQKGLLLNTDKLSRDDFLKMFPNVVPHKYVKNAFLYNKNEYEFGKNPLFDLGAYYIQDPSAMLVTHYLDPKPGDYVLDLCAAPGGKTNHASLLMENKGQIIANDLSSSRAQILLSNVERMGRGNVVVSSCDFVTKAKYFPQSFDKIILDAPCSGSGMFRKMKEMQEDWTYEKVLSFAKIQKNLLSLAATMLKPGGYIVYSTCSYSFEEDEEVILTFLSTHPNFKTIHIGEDNKEFYRSDALKDAIHLFSSLYKGEGHFICLLKNTDEPENNKARPNEEKQYLRSSLDKNKKKITEVYLVKNYVNERFLENALRPGLFVETRSKDGIIPSHHFAKYNCADNSLELNENEFKAYIHGETINKKAPNGYYFVSYMGLNVGVVKCVNDVLKNYYPKGLRR